MTPTQQDVCARCSEQLEVRLRSEKPLQCNGPCLRSYHRKCIAISLQEFEDLHALQVPWLCDDCFGLRHLPEADKGRISPYSPTSPSDSFRPPLTSESPSSPSLPNFHEYVDTNLRRSCSNSEDNLATNITHDSDSSFRITELIRAQSREISKLRQQIASLTSLLLKYCQHSKCSDETKTSAKNVISVKSASQVTQPPQLVQSDLEDTACGEATAAGNETMDTNSPSSHAMRPPVPSFAEVVARPSTDSRSGYDGQKADNAPGTMDNDEGFQLVHRKKQHKPTSPKPPTPFPPVLGANRRTNLRVIGKRPVSAAPEGAIFLSRLAPNTSETEVLAHLSEAHLPGNIVCHRIQTKHPTYASFCVYFASKDDGDNEQLLSREIWPEGSIAMPLQTRVFRKYHENKTHQAPHGQRSYQNTHSKSHF